MKKYSLTKNLAVKFLLSLMVLFTLTHCTSLLEEEVFIDLEADEFWKSDADAILGINAVYAKLRADGAITASDGQQEGWGGFGYGEASIFNYSQVQTDELFVRWSGFNVFSDFTLTPGSYGNFENLFSDLFEGIFIA
jgi:hypothetical protein